jgi:hypothetical protein
MRTGVITRACTHHHATQIEKIDIERLRPLDEFENRIARHRPGARCIMISKPKPSSRKVNNAYVDLPSPRCPELDQSAAARGD